MVRRLVLIIWGAVVVHFSTNTTTTCHELKPLSYLDKGLLFKFVSVDLWDGSRVNGQVIGVYNERPFMWHPQNRDTLALFKCQRPTQGLDSFTTEIHSPNGVFTLNTDEILDIRVTRPPPDATTYVDYLRRHRITIQQQPIQGEEVYILTDWTTYHTWEDGRSNYAWDLSALNYNMMTYSGLGQELTDYAVFGRTLHLPINGTVSSVKRAHPDNAPDLIAAIKFQALDDGHEADLDEKPMNGVEVTPGGPFLLRMLHQKQGSVPQGIVEGQFLEVGSVVGLAGNSGTTFTPHVHLVFGFFDQNGRYWSTPIEWSAYFRRVLLPFPTGYEYGAYKFHEYGYPKVGHLVKLE